MLLDVQSLDRYRKRARLGMRSRHATLAHGRCWALCKPPPWLTATLSGLELNFVIANRLVFVRVCVDVKMARSALRIPSRTNSW